MSSMALCLDTCLLPFRVHCRPDFTDRGSSSFCMQAMQGVCTIPCTICASLQARVFVGRGCVCMRVYIGVGICVSMYILQADVVYIRLDVYVI